MSSAVKPIPDGFHTVTPYLLVKGAAAFIDFVSKAFGGKELDRVTKPDGSVGNATIQIGTSRIMVAESPADRESSSIMLYLYLEDCDAAYNKAIAAGATSVAAPHDAFYGDRNGGVKDQWGNQWWVATHKEDVPQAEMEKRAAAHQRK